MTKSGGICGASILETHAATLRILRVPGAAANPRPFGADAPTCANIDVCGYRSYISNLVNPKSLSAVETFRVPTAVGSHQW